MMLGGCGPSLSVRRRTLWRLAPLRGCEPDAPVPYEGISWLVRTAEVMKYRMDVYNVTGPGNLTRPGPRFGSRLWQRHDIVALSEEDAKAKATDLFKQLMKPSLPKGNPILDRFCLYDEGLRLVIEIRAKDVKKRPRLPQNSPAG